MVRYGDRYGVAPGMPMAQTNTELKLCGPWLVPDFTDVLLLLLLRYINKNYYFLFTDVLGLKGSVVFSALSLIWSTVVPRVVRLHVCFVSRFRRVLPVHPPISSLVVCTGTACRLMSTPSQFLLHLRKQLQTIS